MIQKITLADVTEVYRFAHRIRELKFHKHKKEAFIVGVSTLSERGCWLLSFACWNCLFNSRFVRINASLFHSIVTRDDNATFQDFIRLLRHYEGAKVTSRREGELTKFLARCSPEHHTFYLSLLDKSFIEHLPMFEVQSHLHIDDITVDEVYAAPLAASAFAGLSYPVAVRALVSDVMDVVTLSKTPAHLRFQRVEGRARLDVPANLRRDAKLCANAHFGMAGVLAADGKLYPFDFSIGVLQGYPERVKELTGFIRRSLLSGIDDGPIAVAESAADLPAVLRVAAGHIPTPTQILFSDESSSVTGKVFCVDSRMALGIIESLWVEDGEAKGFKVWLNGSIHDCIHAFPGKENTLLGRPELLYGEVLQMFYIKLDPTAPPVLIANEVLWDARKWRDKRMRGSSVQIEKCVLCGSTQWPHASRGLCRRCECNLQFWFAKYPPGEWIPETVRKFNESRYLSCWEPAMLNAARCRYKGYLLEARDDGMWRFADDPESMELYQAWKRQYLNS